MLTQDTGIINIIINKFHQHKKLTAVLHTIFLEKQAVIMTANASKKELTINID